MASKDADALRELIGPRLSFVGMTPSRVFMGEKAEDLVTTLGQWFGARDHIESIEWLEADGFADRQRVGYRLRVKNPDGTYLVDQTAYLSADDGRITWLRIMCAGYRRADD